MFRRHPNTRPRPRRAFAPEALEARLLLATYTVTNLSNDGSGSLRQAITNANNNAGADVIRFNIPTRPDNTYTIQLSTFLGPITGQVDIDGTTQPGYATAGRPVVQVLGPGSTTSHSGFYFNGADNSRVRGLTISRWSNGILLVNSPGTVIESNWIGLNADGTAALGNRNGINVSGGTGGVRIGGTTAAQRNVISGNTGGETSAGVWLDGDDNVVVGNYIGTNPDGTDDVMNFNGVRVRGNNNRVGGTTAAERNVISGNFNGVWVGKNVPAGPGSPSQIAIDNVVSGNYIGTSASGGFAVPNQMRGVLVGAGADRTVVGGTLAGAGNLISGNGAEGVHVFAPASFTPETYPPPTNTRIEGNVVGLSASGARLGNVTGVLLGNGNTVVGGTVAAARNVISANGVGVKVTASEGRIEGNYIGTNAAGTAAAHNTAGVLIESRFGVVVGGTAPGARNVISSNTRGVQILLASASMPPAGAPPHRIEGNYIGTNAAGTARLAPSGGIGVELRNTTGVVIGGDTAAARNVISAGTDGILLDNARSTVIRGNYIGTNADGGSLGAVGSGNAGAGILANGNFSSFNAVTDNLIAFNGSGGIRFTAGTDNAFLNNSIRNNGQIGIDLGVDGPTPNDPGDADAGPNDRQNHPVLTSAVATAAQTTVAGTLSTNHGVAAFRIQFFSSPAVSASGNAEGAVFLGEMTVNTNSAGNATFTAVLPAVQVDHLITATASRVPTGGPPFPETSEFSPGVRVTPPDVTAPRVTGVFVRGSAWSEPFMRYLENAFLGERVAGFTVTHATARQLDPLPWANLNQISIRFSEPVDVQQGDLVVRATVGDAGVTPPRYNLLSFAYDPPSNTATWRLRRTIARPDRLLLDLDADAPLGVKDLAGNALDGEWDNGADAFPSGDGTPGGDFRFRMNVLPGDANRNGVVNVLDDAHVRRLLGSAAPVNGSFALRYSIFADYNGSGVIDATDYLLGRQHHRRRLPEPAPPPH